MQPILPPFSSAPRHIKELESKSQMLETALNAAAVAEHRLQECQDALESLREQYDILRTDNIHLRHALNSYTRGGLEPDGHVSPLDDDPRAMQLHQEHASEDDEHQDQGENAAEENEGENARPTPPVTQSASAPGLTVEETERLSKMTTSESVNYLKHKLYGGSPPAASPNPVEGGESMVVDEEGDDDDDDDDDATSDVENVKKKRKVNPEEQVAE